MAKELKPGVVVASIYRVLEPLRDPDTGALEAGGFGDVWVGVNERLEEQKVVIKKMRGGVPGVAREEASTLARLEHPNVVHVYAYDEDYDCLVMQYFRGQTLQKVLERRAQPLGLLEAVRLTDYVAQALRAIHNRNVVHRDIKAQNVMVGEQGEVKLIDLGTAMKVGTTVAQASGTPGYAPPEQYNGENPALAANDMYALGSLMYFLLTKQLPFDGEIDAVIKGTFHSAPPDLEEVYLELLKSVTPPKQLSPKEELLLQQLSELYHELLAKDPARRPGAGSVSNRLAEFEANISAAKTELSSLGAVTSDMKAEGGVKPIKRVHSTMVLPKAGQRGPSTEEALVAMKPKRSRRGTVIAALLLVILLLGGALLALTPSGDSVAVKPLPPLDDEVPVALARTEPPPPEVKPEPEAKPEPEPQATTTTPPPEVKPKMGSVAVTVKKPPVTKVEVTRAAACSFDDRYVNYARRTRSQLRSLPGSEGAQFVAADTRLQAALASEDCLKANDALAVMRQIVDP